MSRSVGDGPFGVKLCISSRCRAPRNMVPAYSWYAGFNFINRCPFCDENLFYGEISRLTEAQIADFRKSKKRKQPARQDDDASSFGPSKKLKTDLNSKINAVEGGDTQDGKDQDEKSLLPSSISKGKQKAADTAKTVGGPASTTINNPFVSKGKHGWKWCLICHVADHATAKHPADTKFGELDLFYHIVPVFHRVWKQYLTIDEVTAPALLNKEPTYLRHIFDHLSFFYDCIGMYVTMVVCRDQLYKELRGNHKAMDLCDGLVKREDSRDTSFECQCTRASFLTSAMLRFAKARTEQLARALLRPIVSGSTRRRTAHAFWETALAELAAQDDKGGDFTEEHKNLVNEWRDELFANLSGYHRKLDTPYTYKDSNADESATHVEADAQLKDPAAVAALLQSAANQDALVSGLLNQDLSHSETPTNGE